MAVNEARSGEDMPNVEHGETVQQAVNMAPLGWEPPGRGTAVRAAIRRERLAREAMAIRIGIRQTIRYPECRELNATFIQHHIRIECFEFLHNSHAP